MKDFRLAVLNSLALALLDIPFSLLVLLDILTVFGAYKVYKEELKLND
jgi:hypothetical protein